MKSSSSSHRYFSTEAKKEAKSKKSSAAAIPSESLLEEEAASSDSSELLQQGESAEEEEDEDCLLSSNRGVNVSFNHLPLAICSKVSLLRTYLKQFGRVARIRIVKHAKTGRPNGSAIVRFVDRVAAEAAQETLNLRLIDTHLVKSNCWRLICFYFLMLRLKLGVLLRFWLQRTF
ncbi:MAG: nucleolar protein [Marteilia pararefringens]